MIAARETDFWRTDQEKKKLEAQAMPYLGSKGDDREASAFPLSELNQSLCRDITRLAPDEHFMAAHHHHQLRRHTHSVVVLLPGATMTVMLFGCSSSPFCD